MTRRAATLTLLAMTLGVLGVSSQPAPVERALERATIDAARAQTRAERTNALDALRDVHLRAQSPRVRASSILAMGLLTDDPDLKQDLVDLAVLEDPERTAMQVPDRGPRAEMDALALECVTSIRTHSSPSSRALYDAPEIRSRILSIATLIGLDAQSLDTMIQRRRESADNDPCRGRVFIADPTTRGERSVCPNHVRGVGLCANDQELAAFLALELVLAAAAPSAFESCATSGMTSALRLPSLEGVTSAIELGLSSNPNP